MSRIDLQQLLQMCLDGYDAGLTPEECLSAYPHVRDELEPLLRQALSLRFAYAVQPSEKFVSQGREKLMFAAGREVNAALSSEPDPHFVSQTRRRFLNAAGAEAQEALRDVPPPRLPFWSNARRRLIETASATPPRPAMRPMAMAFGMRSALSAVVVVLAVAVAGAGFFLQNTPGTDRPSTASAQIAEIERTLDAIDRMRAQGQTASSSQLADLAERTSLLVEQIGDDEEAELKVKLPLLIDRAQVVVSEAIASGDGGPELAQTRDQLTAAEEKVAVVTALVELPTVAAAAETTTPTTSQTPVVSATASPTETPEITPVSPVEPVTPEDLADGQVLIQLDPTDTTQDLHWLRITSRTITFVIESSWLPDFAVDQNGFAVLPTGRLVIFPDPQDRGDVIVVTMATGEVIAAFDGEPMELRAEGVDGALIAPEDLVQVAPDLYAVVFHFLTSIQVSE